MLFEHLLVHRLLYSWVQPANMLKETTTSHTQYCRGPESTLGLHVALTATHRKLLIWHVLWWNVGSCLG